MSRDLPITQPPLNASTQVPQSSGITVDFDPFATGEVSFMVPITESQQEVWTSVQLGDAANCAYNESLSLTLRGRLDVTALQTALQNLVRRHEALRTTFSPDGTTLCVAAALTIDIPVTDLTAASPVNRDAQVAAFKQQSVEQPFNLQFGPLLRVRIIQLQAAEHLVILTAHHIICDGWSWAVLLTDLGHFYAAFSQGTVPDLEAPEPFSAYALEQAIATAETLETEAYWLEQFATSVPLLELPTDRPRPPFRTFDSAREDYPLDAALVKALKQVGTRLKCSFMTTLLAGFEVLLHRLTGQEDVIVGVPAAGQAATGKYALVGHCVNLLPIRSQVNPAQPFSDYLKSRRSQVLDAYDHQQFTFGRLLQKLAITRDPSRIPLVPVLFNIDQALDTAQLPFPGLEVDLSTNPRAYENFEWFINATELAGHVTLECQYNTNLFDAETIRRRLAEFETLLRGIVAHPEQRIDRLPLLPVSEQQILHHWNTTQVAYPPVCIHQLIETQVTRSPTAIAIAYADQSLTYETLNTQANQLAHYLQSLGVGPESLVGICVDRSPAMVVSLLAILKAGGSYVPLDPAYPLDRLAYMIEDAKLPILLTQQTYQAQFADQAVQMVCLDAAADGVAIAQQPTTNPTSGVVPDNLAYTIYTSGSTGKPKGVQICHSTAVNFLTAMQQQPGLTSTDALLAVTTISFDIAVLELYLPLMVGARIVLAPQGANADAARISHLLTQSGVTVMQATPVTWRMLMESGWQGDHRLKMLCGGEAMSPELANQLLARGGSLWNMYGPTETTVWSTVCKVEPQSAVITIGTPIANTQLEILDAQYQPTPIGVPGELYIGGAGLARGYLNRPDLTMDRFIMTAGGDRLYKTGDLARWLANGQVECLGRTDSQVKVRGFRIELGEIEAALGQHPAVQQCAVIDREDTPGDKRLVAYIVTPVAAAPTTSDLRHFLRQTLPEYMLPAAFVSMATLPLTPNGKVDRRALPQPDVSDLQTAGTYVAPRSPLEQQLAQIWAKVLKLEQVGIYDNFFDLGGQSILAIRLSAQIEKQLGQSFPITQLLQAPTIADQSTLLHDPTPPEPTATPQLPVSPSLVSPSLSKNLVLLRKGNDQPPLFLIYGILIYREVALALTTDRPVYAVYLQEEIDLVTTGNLDLQQSIFRNIAMIADRYLQAIRTRQPYGPYYLAGESFGGVVALEMAQQLQAAGETVELVGLLDSELPTQTPAQISLFQRLRLHGQFFAAKGLPYVTEKLQAALDRKRRKVVDKVQARLPQLLPANYRESEAFLEAQQANIQATSRYYALQNYVPKPYKGRLVLFRAIEQDPFAVVTPDLDWGTLAKGGLQVFDIPGDHLSILRAPNVQVLAEKLSECLDPSTLGTSRSAIAPTSTLR
jgi:amino acid adenylation domain-containing protein